MTEIGRLVTQIQHEYMLAKMQSDQASERYSALEAAYILEHKIVNPDGTIPKEFGEIADEDAALKAALDFEDQYGKSDESLQLVQAWIAMWKAGDKAVSLALAFMPEQKNQELEEATKMDIHTRHKAIDLIMGLDARAM